MAIVLKLLLMLIITLVLDKFQRCPAVLCRQLELSGSPVRSCCCLNSCLLLEAGRELHHTAVKLYVLWRHIYVYTWVECGHNYHFHTLTVLVLAPVPFWDLRTFVFSSEPARVHTGLSGTKVPLDNITTWRWSGLFAKLSLFANWLTHLARKNQQFFGSCANQLFGFWV